jgi:hypothetical protein
MHNRGLPTSYWLIVGYEYELDDNDENRNNKMEVNNSARTSRVNYGCERIKDG